MRIQTVILYQSRRNSDSYYHGAQILQCVVLHILIVYTNLTLILTIAPKPSSHCPQIRSSDSTEILKISVKNYESAQ